VSLLLHPAFPFGYSMGLDQITWPILAAPVGAFNNRNRLVASWLDKKVELGWWNVPRRILVGWQTTERKDGFGDLAWDWPHALVPRDASGQITDHHLLHMSSMLIRPPG
jgi:hypothetical protein